MENRIKLWVERKAGGFEKMVAYKDLTVEELKALKSELEAKFAGEGRVLIRPSGTEPKVRVMIEGKDQAVIEQEARKLADLIQNTML